MSDTQEDRTPALLTLQRVSTELGVSERVVRRLDRVGALQPVLRTPGKDYWSASDVIKVKAGTLGGGGQ